MTPKKRSTTDALKILHQEFINHDPQMRQLLEEARNEADVARKIRHLRRKHGLTQRQLADLIKTTPSVISRLESADYGGHSLAMLHRIAGAFGQSVAIRFVPVKAKRSA